MLATVASEKPKPRLLDRAALEAEKGRRSLYSYVRMAWPIVEPTVSFVANWHLEAICEHLQAVTEGQIKNLLINVPPGCSKSIITCVFWPSWEWTRDASIKWLFASYAESLSIRDALKCRDILDSEWYRTRWPHVKIKGDQDEKKYYATTATGWRYSTSVGGGGTGYHPNRKVVDDPHNVRQALSKTERDTVITWNDQTLSSRGASLGATFVVIMQRIHEQDLSGHLLAKGDPDLVHLCLPMRYEPKRMVTTPLGFVDPRTEQGELLAPAQFPEAAVSAMERNLGSYGAAGQLQQRPAPAFGGIFRRAWLGKTYSAIPNDFDMVLQSWDCAFKGTSDSDFVVGQVWGRRGGQFYLLDQVRDRMNFSATLRAIERMSAKWPAATTKLVEDKANGTAVIETLSQRLPGLIAVEPHGGKEARAAAVSPLFEAGNVFLPSPEHASWIGDYVEEMVSFPRAVNDDQVDATSQALVRMMTLSKPAFATGYDTTMARPPGTFGQQQQRGPLSGGIGRSGNRGRGIFGK